MKNLSKIEKEFIRGTYLEHIGNTIKHKKELMANCMTNIEK